MLKNKTMFAIYTRRLDSKDVRILDTAESLGEAKEKLDEQAKKFVTFEEGERRITDVWQKEPVDYSKFPDGYYFIKSDDFIDVHRKITLKKEVTSWFGYASQVIEYKSEHISYFGITRYTAEVLTKLCEYRKPARTVSEKTDTPKIGSCDNLFQEMAKYGFKPKKTTVTLKIPNPETENEKNCHIELKIMEDPTEESVKTDKPEHVQSEPVKTDPVRIDPPIRQEPDTPAFEGWTSELRGRDRY
jgi:hypothetical protein